MPQARWRGLRPGKGLPRLPLGDGSGACSDGCGTGSDMAGKIGEPKGLKDMAVKKFGFTKEQAIEAWKTRSL